MHDAFLGAAKTGPLHVAEYSVLLMHASEGRCYSTAEMEGYLREAGPALHRGCGGARDHDGGESLQVIQFPVPSSQFSAWKGRVIFQTGYWELVTGN